MAASAGGVGLVLGTIFGVSTISTWGAAGGDCNNGCLPGTKAQAERSQALTDATVSTVGFIAGGVLLAGGVALWLTAPAYKETALPGPASVAMVQGPGGSHSVECSEETRCSVSVSGRFGGPVKRPRKKTAYKLANAATTPASTPRNAPW